MKLEISNTELSVIIEALGKEKSYLNAQGHRDSAHQVSEIQSRLKNGEVSWVKNS
jgi:hypothetical protein